MPDLGELGSSHGSGSFISGELEAANSRELTVGVTDGYRRIAQRVRIDKATEFCIKRWDATWSDLTLGDAVQCGLYADRGGTVTARYVNANFMARLAEVAGEGDDYLLVSIPRDYHQLDGPGYHCKLMITDTTRVGRIDGQVHVGNAGGLSSGDYIHFTATTETPGDYSPKNAWALSINEYGTT